MRGISPVARPALLPMLLASTMLTGIAPAFADSGSSTIETVVVTAEKRTEDLQRVPLSIQVLSTEKLEQLHISSFQDYVQYLPSVSFSENAAGGGLSDPGFANVNMRGVSSGNDGNHSGSQPTVGIYLDEEPITTIGGALDVHVYDIARVEVLAGPQGTLYGASSEAGTIRIITNKPDPSGFSAAYDVQANQTDHGGTGGEVEGFVNVPIADNVAIRLVGWTEHDAGYIDNVAGTDPNAGTANGVRTFPTGPIAISNAAFVKHDYNNTDIYGARAALKIDLDDNWTITPTLMGQDTRAYGSYAYDPAVGDLKVVKFNPEFSHDRWYQAGLTVEGKIANLDVTYAGAYMDRRINSQLDYSDYSYFYDAAYGQYFTNASSALINPSQIIIGADHFTKQSDELRVASPSDQRLRFIAGLFYQRQTHLITQDYTVPGLDPALTIPGWPNTLWLTLQERVDTDYAAFADVSYDIVPSVTLTAGGRIFESNNSLNGFFGFSNGWDSLTGFGSGMPNCFAPPSVGTGPCTDLNKVTDEKGFTHRLNLTWRIDDSKMVYATWSTGFRPGGVNRNASVTSDPYKPDYLTNYEAGWKTAWAGDTLQFDGAVFWEDWKNFQFSYLGPNSLTVIANIGGARIVGLESNIDWKPTDKLTLTAAGTYVDAELTTLYCRDTSNPCTNVGAPVGQQLPITPRFKGNVTARYTFDLASFDSYLQGALVYNGSSSNDLRIVEGGILGKNPAYTIANFSTGIARDDWTLDLSLENAFDERAQLYRYSECTPTVCGAETYVIPNRPRMVALKFGQKF